MKKITFQFLSSLLLLFFMACNRDTVKPDTEFDVSVTSPFLASIKPTIYVDESHNNHHRISATYGPFAALITNDGCIVIANTQPITNTILEQAAVYVIPTAMGKEDPGEKSPFARAEIDALESWVEQGGSALIITEHYPFGIAMTSLLNAFGVTVHNGYSEDSLLRNTDILDAMLFDKAKGHLVALHPILDHVDRINTFTGSSVKGDSTWTQLLLFSPAAQNYNVTVDVQRDGNDVRTSVAYADPYPATGYSQGICKQYGKGRVVVLAESALLTAQVDKNGNTFGMNIPNTDNKQFALNIMRWLLSADPH